MPTWTMSFPFPGAIAGHRFGRFAGQGLRRALAALLAALLPASRVAGGGGGGSAGPAVAPPPAIPDGWPISLQASSDAITVRWSPLATAVRYTVWHRPAGQTGGGTASRTLAADLPTVHTIPELGPGRTTTVWVTAELPAAGSSRSAEAQLRTTAGSATPQTRSSYRPGTQSLPVLVIDTAGGVAVDNREDYRSATFSLFADSAGRDSGVRLAAGAVQIRGRGHSSWEQHPKKPYRLRLATATALLGMPANRHWVLLANHSDKTLLRNDLAFEIARRIGLPYTTRSRTVEVTLNGDYLGAYSLVEHIRQGSERVAVAELGASADDNTEPRISGGYLLEVDRTDATDPGFNSRVCTSQSPRMRLTVQTPDPPTATQLAWIDNYWNQTERALHAGNFADPVNGYAAWIDVDSFVDWIIHAEIVHNIDSFRFSTFLTKDRGQKLRIGPVWDFDLAMGNYDTYFSDRPGRTDGFSPALTRCWYSRLMADPAFVSRVKARWAALRAGSLADLSPFLREQARLTAPAAANNEARWGILSAPLWKNVVAAGSYDAEVEYLDWWLQRRLRWLDSQWRQAP